MRPVAGQTSERAAFTIVELLTVMSIIVILIGLLVPALNKVKAFARDVKQRAQFHSIDTAVELFTTEFDGYPPSVEENTATGSYCGAMKLCEAMVGQDLLGFHPDSTFVSNNPLYQEARWASAEWQENVKSRSGPYLPLDNANAYHLGDIYGAGKTGTYAPETFVLCDVYTRSRESGKKIGMPILYYKANPSGVTHDPNAPIKDNYYDYMDNHLLVKLGKPGEPADSQHLLYLNNGAKFYEVTKNRDIVIQAGRPYREDSYVLISAGNDGEYGTRDDIFNF